LVQGKGNEKASQVTIRRVPDGDALRLSLQPVSSNPR
jgi:hypothetical protein